MIQIWPDRRSNFDDVGEFHQKFDLDNTTHHDEGPRNISGELLGMRLNFLLEELTEIVLAAGAHFQPLYEDPVERTMITGMKIVMPGDLDDARNIDHAEMFDGLLDLAYVVFGTAHLMGYPWQKGWDLVQRANMGKVRAQSAEESKRGSSFDVVKPEGWKPPRIDALLAYMGWDTYRKEKPA